MSEIKKWYLGLNNHNKLGHIIIMMIITVFSYLSYSGDTMPRWLIIVVWSLVLILLLIRLLIYLISYKGE